MFTKRRLGTLGVLIGLVFAFALWLSTSSRSYERPPQFVIFSFDGSYSRQMWQMTRAFSARMSSDRKPIKFTYFVSGVYFLPNISRDEYRAPKQPVGESLIGFGGDDDEIGDRIHEVKLTAAAGHEIASHANGHFDGRNWTAKEWTDELRQFDSFLFRAESLPELEPMVVGFRAPQLGWNDALFEALASKRYRYDASRIGRATGWPIKVGQLWSFSLARIPLASSGVPVIAMDYSFYQAHSNAEPDPANASSYEDDMFATYLRYFQSNYDGPRAPIQFLHHFDLYNKGAYFAALQRLAERVCGLPDVRCTSYRELVNWLDQLPSAQLKAYRRH